MRGTCCQLHLRELGNNANQIAVSKPWGEKMQAELQRIASQDGLSKDVFEIVSSALAV